MYILVCISIILVLIFKGEFIMRFTKDDLKKALTFYVKAGGASCDVYVALRNLVYFAKASENAYDTIVSVYDAVAAKVDALFYDDLGVTYDKDTGKYTASAKYHYDTNVDLVIDTLKFEDDFKSDIVQTAVPQDIWACKFVDILFENIDAGEIEI